MGRFRDLKRWLLLPVVVSCCVLAAAAQMNTAEIAGLITDPTGAAIPNASIEAVETSTQVKYTANSNATGEFLFPQLPVGEYTLSATATGFKRSVQSGIAVHAGQKLRQNFALQLGEATQIETVSAAPGLLQTESAAINNTIEQQQVVDMPLKGRNVIDLVGLTPGVTNPPAGTRGAALQQTGNT